MTLPFRSYHPQIDAVEPSSMSLLEFQCLFEASVPPMAPLIMPPVTIMLTTRISSQCLFYQGISPMGKDIKWEKSWEWYTDANVRIPGW
jgi:hypothetical protein